MARSLKVTLLLFTLIFLTSCGNEEDQESNLVAIDTPAKLVILSERTFFIGGEEVTLAPPWSPLNFSSINNTKELITIVAGTLLITDPLSGNTKQVSLISYENLLTPYLGVIFPSLDTNCDGQVDESEEETGQGPVSPCENLIVLDQDGNQATETMVLLDERQFYMTEMVNFQGEGLLSDAYRGSVFSVEVLLEGWFGSPDRPQRNFFKRYFFTTSAN